MRKSAMMVGLLLAALLSGCSGGTDDQVTTTQDIGKGDLADGKGGIAGVVIDDRYRPIGGAKLFLMPLGLSATGDALGQFEFRDLDPGTYQLRIEAKDHEGAPVPIDVTAGEFTEVEAPARRIFNQDGTIITTQYSVFIDCSAETPVLALAAIPITGCMGDTTGDSTRAYFISQLSENDANLTTYMVTEVLFNQKGDYTVAIRDGNTFDDYFSEADLLKGNYLRIVNQDNVTNDAPSQNQGRNIPWDPALPYQTIVFPHGEFYGEIHSTVCPPGVPGVVSFTCLFGLGADLGVKAQIVQSVFLGPPEVDIDSYAVLKPADA
ncbi:MAG: Carboxypeptidase regulatory-like domain [Thermoplasmata archaeon]|jgi:hypothetical protein|nr:Carboxypeptidase regulatory-like domain [Thermoplasmata archaeon]